MFLPSAKVCKHYFQLKPLGQKDFLIIQILFRLARRNCCGSKFWKSLCILWSSSAMRPSAKSQALVMIGISNHEVYQRKTDPATISSHNWKSCQAGFYSGWTIWRIVTYRISDRVRYKLASRCATVWRNCWDFTVDWLYLSFSPVWKIKTKSKGNNFCPLSTPFALRDSWNSAGRLGT